LDCSDRSHCSIRPVSTAFSSPQADVLGTVDELTGCVADWENDDAVFSMHLLRNYRVLKVETWLASPVW